MALADELDRAAEAAAPYGSVSAVLAAEPGSGRRSYLVALGDGEESRQWLVLDAGFRPVEERERVREAASIVVLCELAGELAGGAELEELRARLSELEPAGRTETIDAADAAAVALEHAIGTPPILASPAYLDHVGAATRKLEQLLGEHASPFANALASTGGTVEAFVAEVEGRHRLPLR
jgi:hypothetical protein